MSTQDGSIENPFQMKPTGSDRFYWIFDDFLDSGDTISTAVFSGPTDVALSGDQVNSTPLELDGVTYAANRVATVIVSSVDLDDMVEVVCLMTSAAGRIEPASFWFRGVNNYGA